MVDCSNEAFRERLETSRIKRELELERASRPKKIDTRRGMIMRRIEDVNLAKSLGLSLDELE